MFARSKNIDSKKPYPVQYCEVERSFTKLIKPIVSKSSIAKESMITSPTPSNATNTTSRTNRTGDSASYYCSNNNVLTLARSEARRGYRVLSYTEDRDGKIHIFDIIDGHAYHCSRTTGKRITNDAVVFESRSGAMSERFPSNQHRASKSGNGYLPRVLVTFDFWGKCRRRLGGGLAFNCEFVKFMRIENFLDPPTPVPARIVKTPVEPNYFPAPETQKRPNRRVNSKRVKLYKLFDDCNTKMK